MSEAKEWKTCSQNRNYQISNWGKVRRCKSGSGAKVGKIIKMQISNSGYYQVKLFNESKGRWFYVHALVAEAFLGPCPKGHEVNHIDGNKQNPRIDNLEYMTRKKNLQHAVRIGRIKLGEYHHFGKVTNKNVIKIKKMYESGDYYQREIAERFNITQAWVSEIVNNKKRVRC